MKLAVKFKDANRGQVEINVGPRAEVALERQYDIATADATRNEHLYYLAWAALHFAGQEPSEFDVFLDSIEDVDLVEEPEAKKGPTRRAQRQPASSA